MIRRGFLTIVLAHALVVAAFDGSGDGSGEDDRCSPPNPRPELLGGSIDVAGFMEPRCHLACIESISLEEGIIIEPSTIYPAWPMIPDSVLQKNCTLYKMVQVCREGCSSRRYSKCTRSCSEMDCQTTNPAICQICEQKYCMRGCDVMQELEAIQNDTHGIPPDPIGPLQLHIADGINDVHYVSDAGLYTMDPTQAVPTEQSMDVVRYPTVIVIRVFFRKVKYMWMASFEERLNLTAYACDEILIHIGVVNKFGQALGSYTHTSSLKIEVYGESPPTHTSHPVVGAIDIVADTREGFWKHAVITIRWKRAIRGFELLDHYLVHFQLDMSLEQPYCKPNNLTKVVFKDSHDDVKSIIKAQSLGDGPVSDCYYTIQVESISMNRSIMTAPAQIHDVHIASSDTVPVPLEANSTQTWDSKTGYFTYKTDWRIPEDSNVQRAIGVFELRVDAIAPDGTIELLHVEHYNTSDRGSLYYHYSQQFNHKGPNYQHRITLKSHPGDISLIVLTPAPRVFPYSASAIQPDQVEDVNITYYAVKEANLAKAMILLDIVVVWTAVTENTDLYNLRVVTENTTRNNVPTLHTLETMDAFAAIDGLKIILDNTLYIYIQVMAESRYMVEGPWSEPVSIELPSPADITPRPQNTSTGDPLQGGSSSDDGQTGEVIYTIVSVIVALVVCVAVLSVIIFFVCYPTMRNKHRRRRRVDIVIMTRKASDKDKYTVGKLDQWEIYSNQVAIQSRLGEGAFGDVYRGLYNSSVTKNSCNIPKFNTNNSVVVAVKLLRDDATDKDRQIFLKYILQAKKVAQYQHSHLVCMVGCVTEQEPLSLLTEYPAHGDLLTYLRTQRQEMYQSQLQSSYKDVESGSPQQLTNTIPDFNDNDNHSLQAQDLMLFISHVAAGLEHLATIGVVHGDVACRNLFLTADKIVKIADFGLDSISEEEKGLVYMQNELGRLPIRWMAIESIRDGEFSTASDVWAFGVTLWEIASLGGFPYHDTANSDILPIVSAGQRLQCPINCSEEIYGIMLKCCAAFPGDRPSFSTLHHVFKSLHSTANNGQYITLNIDTHSAYYLASPRNSIIEPPMLSDDCVPLDDPLEADTAELINKQQHGGIYTTNPLPTQHLRQGSSYSYSESGFLPCITEEGEDVSDNDDETIGGEDDDGEKRDSGNDSTFSHESGRKLTKESDKDDSEENLIIDENIVTVELL